MPEMTVAEAIKHLETLSITGGEIDLTQDEFHAIRLSITILKTLAPDLVRLIDAIMAKEPELSVVDHVTV
ncbi:hypothetical protein ES705_22613 [subsurface metagenome]